MQVKTIATVLLISLVLLSSSFGKNEQVRVGGLDDLRQPDCSAKYSILLALSGGGARGLASIGIIKALEEKGIKVAAVAGTSIGGIIGGLYASGYSPDELIELTNSFGFDSLFENSPSRTSMFLTQREERDRHLISIRFNGLVPVLPRALTKAQRLTTLLTSLTARAGYHSGSDFQQLPIPFKTVTVDIVSGKKITVENGSLADAMRATMAFPLAFTPVEKDDQLLMDGGILVPIPVDLVKTMSDSVSFVVAVNTSSSLMSNEKLTSPIRIANQVTNIMSAERLSKQLSLADLVISPDLKEYRSSDFAMREEIIDIGYRSGLQAADSIIKLLETNSCEGGFMVERVEGPGLPTGMLRSLNNWLAGETVTRVELKNILRSALIDHGMYSMEGDLRPVTDSSASDNDHFILSLNEHQLLDLDEIQFRFAGNSVFSDSALIAAMDIKSGYLTPTRLKEALDRALQLYRQAGHDLTIFDEVFFDSEALQFTITVNEVIIRRIDIKDNRKTKDWFVRSHFPLKVGQPYSTELVSEGIANIFATDLFNRVTVDLAPHPEGAVVIIGVEEKHYQQVRLGWHWDETHDSEEFLEVLNDNIMGIGLEYLFHFRYAVDRQRYVGSFKTNRLWSTYLTANLSVYHNRLDRGLFNTDGVRHDVRKEIKSGIMFEIGQQIARLGTATAGVIFEQTKYRFRESPAKEKFGLRILRLRSMIENLDRVTFPRTGSKQMFEIRFAGKFLGGGVEYTRFNSSIETYFPLTGRLNYHPKLKVGISRSGLPGSEQFYLGGATSFAGFNTYQLAGDKMFLLSNELRLQLPVYTWISVRYDMGEVYNHRDQIKLRNLRHAFSASLALGLPLGPVELRYGVADSDTDQWHLNIGLQF